MARPRPEKKREPQAAADTKILPMDLRVGDRLADETGEWEVVGRPYTSNAGKNARVRVQKFGQPDVAEVRTWGAHERISVKLSVTVVLKAIGRLTAAVCPPRMPPRGAPGVRLGKVLV